MTEKQTPIAGGCHCGAVRYESIEPPTNGGYCHCKWCQRLRGGFHAVMVLVPRSGFRFTKGEPKYYKSSDAGRRGFCPECGSPVVGLFDGVDTASLPVGSLDHPEDWPVNQKGWFGHFYVDSKIPWEIIGDDLPQHQGYGDSAFVDLGK